MNSDDNSVSELAGGKTIAIVSYLTIIGLVVALVMNMEKKRQIRGVSYSPDAGTWPPLGGELDGECYPAADRNYAALQSVPDGPLGDGAHQRHQW